MSLTAAKVQAYAAYQRIQVDLTLEGLKDLQRVADGGEDDPAVQDQLYPAMKARAAKDEAARRASGLSLGEVRYLEQLVTEVVGKRSFARGVNFDAQIQKMKSLRSQLPPEQRRSLDQSLERLEADQRDLVELREQRQKYGDANVDLVLSHEAEFSENLRRSLDAFGAARSPGGR